jgi:hypothetical protein
MYVDAMREETLATVLRIDRDPTIVSERGNRSMKRKSLPSALCMIQWSRM